jgi:acetyl esterase
MAARINLEAARRRPPYTGRTSEETRMLHPQARALLRLIEERGVPPTHLLTPAQAREAYRERRFFTQPAPPDVGTVRDLQASGPAGPIPLRFYRPLGIAGDTVLPVLVYYHGGGWVIGDLDTHDTLCRELCNLSGCAVVAVDYRMGPEHRFPAAVDDSIAAARWVRQQAAALHIDASRVAVGGDSAGGNLAAVVALALRDAGEPVTFQLLIYPATDQRRGAESHRTNGQGYLLTSDSITYFHDHYIERPEQDLDWRCSPLLHDDHRGLPPAFVLTAGYDPLRDEGLQYAQKLTEAGVTTALVNFERQIHGFILMGKAIDEANVAVQLCAAQLRRALGA